MRAMLFAYLLANAINIHDSSIAGLVLNSSVVNYKKTGAVPSQNLAAIRIPVLVLHHNKNACVHCRPYEVSNILSGLKNATTKNQIMVDSGVDPTEDPCEGRHWNGFIGMETEAIKLISDWIKQPAS